MAKSNEIRWVICLFLLVIPNCLCSDELASECFGNIPRSLASLFDLEEEGTVLRRLPYRGTGICLELELPNTQKYWYRFIPTDDGDYYGEVTDISTGNTEELITVARNNGDKPQHLEKSIVEKYAGLDFTKTSRKMLENPFSNECSSNSQPEEDQLGNENCPEKNNLYDEVLQEATLVSVQGNSWSTYLLVGGSAALSLVGYYYLLENTKAGMRYLLREDLWSSWKSEEPYGVLLSVEPKYLAGDLIADINIVYYQEPDPIKLFLRDIQLEADIIMQWMQFKNICGRFGIPLGDEFFSVENRLKLLDLMRKAAYYWRGQQWSNKKDSQ